MKNCDGEARGIPTAGGCVEFIPPAGAKARGQSSISYADSVNK